MLPQYSYISLPGPDHIRLAVLQPGNFDDELRVDLTTAAFNHAVSLSYEALSYVWGTQSNPSRVRIIGPNAKSGWTWRSHRKITQNLDQALRYLRYPTKPRTLWIDALCINQDDDNEKGVQVRKMGSIYRRASSVLVWLGPARSHTQAAMDWMERIETQVDVDWVINMVKIKDTIVNDANFCRWHRDALLLNPKLARGVLHVLQAPWFHRVWIRQEIYLANQDQAKVLCGPWQTSWIAFRTCLAALREIQYCVRVDYVTGFLLETDETRSLQESIRDAISNLDAFIFQQATFGLENLRRMFGDAECHDGRDRIFAALDMLTARDAEIAGAPDYVSDIGQVYTNVAARWYRANARARLLKECSLQESTDKGMPSWVPDWSRPLPAEPLQGRSSTNLATSISLPDTSSTRLGFGSVLSVYGIPGPLITQLGTFVPHGSRGRSDLRGILTALLPLSCFDRFEAQSPDGPQGTTVLEQYATVICGERFRERHQPPDPRYPSLRDAVSFLHTWLRLETRSDIEAHMDAFSLFSDEAAEVLFFHCVCNALGGRCLALGPSGEIMVVPASARLGDRVCVFLGCDHPILLRPFSPSGPHEGARYQVIGCCFTDGMQWGEALLGPLPLGIARVLDNQVERHVWVDTTINKVIATLDPRLEPLLQKLPKEIADDFRQRKHKNEWSDLHLDHAHLDILRDHRLEVFATGGDLQEFHLV